MVQQKLLVLLLFSFLVVLLIRLDQAAPPKSGGDPGGSLFGVLNALDRPTALLNEKPPQQSLACNQFDNTINPKALQGDAASSKINSDGDTGLSGHPHNG